MPTKPTVTQFGLLTVKGLKTRRYADKDAALLAARRAARRTAETISVVWLRDGSPKVWLAYVTAESVQKTEFWEI